MKRNDELIWKIMTHLEANEDYFVELSKIEIADHSPKEIEAHILMLIEAGYLRFPPGEHGGEKIAIGWNGYIYLNRNRAISPNRYK